MSLRKILETFIRFFPSSFNRKYVHTVACAVVFVGPAHFVFNAYPGRNATCPLSSCSNNNDGHAVALISVKVGKGVFHMIPGHVLDKSTGNLYMFFSFLFQ